MGLVLCPITFRLMESSTAKEIRDLTNNLNKETERFLTQKAIADKYRVECHDLLERHDDLVFTNQALNDEVVQLQRKLNIAIRWSYAVTAAIVAGLLVLLW